MTASLFAIMMRFVFSFIVLQFVAVAGSLFMFRQHKNRRAWLWAAAALTYLNTAYYFLFKPPPEAAALRALVEYALLYPFFAYMLVCMALVPLFAAAGLYSLLAKLAPSAGSFRRSPAAQQGSAPDAGRRDFMKLLASAAALPMAGSSLYGSYVGKNKLAVEDAAITFAGLPAALDGFTIAQISDIHAGPFMDKRELQEIVKQVTDLDADIAVITGDIINWGSAFLPDVFDGLAGIRARSGVFAVLGNHDHYCNTAELCRGVERAGVQMLRDRFLPLTRAGSEGPLYLAGIDDPLVRGYAVDSSCLLQKVMRGIPDGGFTVLLSHRPSIFDHAAAAGIQLTLSGHTHGGQFILPGSGGGHGWSLARLRYERDYGLYRHHKAFLYINRGIGVVGPPVRINCPREITKIVLRREG